MRRFFLTILVAVGGTITVVFTAATLTRAVRIVEGAFDAEYSWVPAVYLSATPDHQRIRVCRGYPQLGGVISEGFWLVFGVP